MNNLIIAEQNSTAFRQDTDWEAPWNFEIDDHGAVQDYQPHRQTHQEGVEYELLRRKNYSKCILLPSNRLQY